MAYTVKITCKWELGSICGHWQGWPGRDEAMESGYFPVMERPEIDEESSSSIAGYFGRANAAGLAADWPL